MDRAGVGSWMYSVTNEPPCARGDGKYYSDVPWKIIGSDPQRGVVCWGMVSHIDA